uniref:Uncharacterized protein n=1 Tax=viral metagenome TaxID=1070528 RepID=A0A6C0AK74_9ZZZZ
MDSIGVNRNRPNNIVYVSTGQSVEAYSLCGGVSKKRWIH